MAAADENFKPCNFLCADIIEASVHYKPYVPISVRLNYLVKNITGSVHSMIHPTPQKSPSAAATGINVPLPEITPLNLQPGEWVRIKSLDEIYQTLDENRKYKGLLFMPVMAKFCGKQFWFFKIAKVIKLETTGEIRKLKSPTVFLDGVYCDGKKNDGCDRSCFHFWKEAWLERISDPSL